MARSESIRERIRHEQSFGSDRDRLLQIVERMPAPYLARYTDADVMAHLADIASLRRNHPFTVSVRDLQGETDLRVRVTVISADRRGMFSLITGLLAGAGLNIESGHVYTLEARSAPEPKIRRGGRFTGRRGAAVGSTYLPRLMQQKSAVSWAGDDAVSGAPGKVIVDEFEGTLDPKNTDFAAVLSSQFDLLFGFLTEGDEIGARQFVAEEVAAQVAGLEPGTRQVLAPIQVVLEESSDEMLTRISVTSEDTPFFLYSISNALNLHDVVIEQVLIQTDGTRIRDVFDIRDASGGSIRNDARIEQIRLSILLTKQFTFVLDRAPDPYAAMQRFDRLIGDFRDMNRGEDVERLISDTELQQELALLLGASDFLWEDFIRRQQDQLLPLLTRLEHRSALSTPEEQLGDTLDAVLADARRTAAEAGRDPVDEQVAALNEFKDRESYLIDLDHMLLPDLDFFFLSRRLTTLAERVVQNACILAWQRCEARYGRPRTAAGLTARWAVFGLGKLGGSALGYASDIELLFMYSDSGQTDGRNVDNAVFFENFVQTAVSFVHARREGIFQTDLRLRPHGNDGPLAVKLDRFLEYYSAGGAAHSVERLALVRLRRIGGDDALGRQVERIRDEILYESDCIDVPEVRKLRATQLNEKAADRVNAKFSPGALVDLEYNVQLLQITHGRRNDALRCPGIHEALRALSDEGTIDDRESETMVSAYRFLRTLINGLRMLRGNAQDLLLPAAGSSEFNHLARRIGYSRTGGVSAARRLEVDFETQTAIVRDFVERHLGEDAIPGSRSSGPADLILVDLLPEELRREILSRVGVADPARAWRNMQSMKQRVGDSRLFATVVLLGWESLRTLPDPDMALNNWDRFIASTDDAARHCQELAGQPERIRLLLILFGTSQFLSDILIRDPALFRWITDPETVARPRTEAEMQQLLTSACQQSTHRREWQNAIRSVRKHEILRIGMRDLCLRIRVAEAAAEISNLARAILVASLQAAWVAEQDSSGDPPPGVSPLRFAVLAFGKLGGMELNYSSDIDLLAVYDNSDTGPDAAAERYYSAVLRRLVQDLTEFTDEGQAYRVDLRLRPHGNAGPPVVSCASAIRYYENEADLWELQAMIKCRPVAGAMKLGSSLVNAVHEAAAARASADAVAESVTRMRQTARDVHVKDGQTDVKNGAGGIRDVEFLAQALQLVHARTYPGILVPDTLSALARLAEIGILDRDECAQLSSDYQLLRQAEHFLQLAEDRQLHNLPDDGSGLARLAYTLHFSDGGSAVADHIRQRMQWVHTTFRDHLSRLQNPDIPTSR